MSFDGIFLHYMSQELSEALLGGRIQKVSQPFEQELLFIIRSQKTSHRLLLSAHPQFCRIQLTKTDFLNPQTASTFVMILRKYLVGAVIEKIEQIENDRQLWIHLLSKNEIGDPLKLAIVCEIMGKHSNIILLDKAGGKIIECIKHVGPSQNQYRMLLPGANYIAPPASNFLNPFTASERPIFEILQTYQKFQGVGKDSASALFSLSLNEFKERLSTLLPSIYPDDRFSAIELNKDYKKYENLSELLDVYYLDKAERDRVKQVAAELIRKVSNELKKEQKKLKKLKKELSNTENAEDFRQKGELLTTFLNQVPNNQTEVTLENYYTGKTIKIHLDLALSPSQNAQRYFHKYQKLKQAVKFLSEEIRKTQQSIHYLESVESELENSTVSEINDIREELMETGYIKKRQSKNNKRQKAVPPEKYQAKDGTVILVGKNNLQNDQVSFKLSKKGDLWFHVKDMPGSHVLITGNPSPPDETLTFAGELAAYFSKGRYSNLVQVDMIEVKKLHKPTGTPPGFVTYTGQKTIRVTPDEDRIRMAKID